MNKRFTEQLARCQCCPRHCRAERLAGKTGFCRIPAEIRICHAGLHHGEEPPVSGTNGSGTIFFAGCNLSCVFCQNYQISQEFQQFPSRVLTVAELASEMLHLQAQGAHNINFVSPSHMIFQMADAITEAKGRGLIIPVVYNSNGYDSVDALRQIRGLVDIYLPDIKYLENGLGKQFSGVHDYADTVPGVLREMFHQVGRFEMNDAGIAVRGLLVRHLVLPGFQENSRRCLRLLADLLPNIFISIMSQYTPQYKATSYAGLNRPLAGHEYDAITDYALALGLENVFIQELASQDSYLPDFARESPFDPTAAMP
jgi:putative pyruvate formate lyase activating enzyme